MAKYPRWVSMKEMSEELAKRDDVVDTVYDLRGVVCTVMKEKKYIAEDEACSEYQGNIDAVIRRLVEKV